MNYQIQRTDGQVRIVINRHGSLSIAYRQANPWGLDLRELLASGSPWRESDSVRLGPREISGMRGMRP